MFPVIRYTPVVIVVLCLEIEEFLLSHTCMGRKLESSIAMFLLLCIVLRECVCVCLGPLIKAAYILKKCFERVFFVRFDIFKLVELKAF